MALPTRVAEGAVASVASGALTLAYPTSIQADDILVACITIRSTVGFAEQDGWTLIQESLGGNTATSGGIASGQMFWKRYDGTGTQQVFARTGGDLATGAIIAIRGCATSISPVHASSLVTRSGTTGALVPTDITTTVADCFLLWQNSLADNGTVNSQEGTVPASWTERVDAGTNTGADGGININHGDMASAETTSQISANSTVGGTHVVILAAFRPEPPTIANDVLVRVGADAKIVATALSLAIAVTGVTATAALAVPTFVMDHDITAPSVTATGSLTAPPFDTGTILQNDVMIRVGSDAKIVATFLTAPSMVVSSMSGTGSFTAPTLSLGLQEWLMPSLFGTSAFAGSVQRLDWGAVPDSMVGTSAFNPREMDVGGALTVIPDPAVATGVVPTPPLDVPLLVSIPATTGQFRVPALGTSPELLVPSLAGTGSVTEPSMPLTLQTFRMPSLSSATDLMVPYFDDGAFYAFTTFGEPPPQRTLVDLRTDVRANLASQPLARIQQFVRCTYTVSLDHSGTCELEVMPDASYLPLIQQGRVLRITAPRAGVHEYRITRITQSLSGSTVLVSAVPVIYDLNRYFLWQNLGGIPSFVLGASDLTAAEWITGFVIPTLVAAGVSYVRVGTVESTRKINLEWAGQTAQWLLNQVIDGTDYDLWYGIANPGEAVEYYEIRILHLGVTAPSPRIIVGENAEALEWSVDGEPQANVIIPQGKIPSGGIERTNIGEYVARVVSVEGNAVTLEDPDGNPVPVYVDDQVTDLYAELLVPPIPGGAIP